MFSLGVSLPAEATFQIQLLAPARERRGHCEIDDGPQLSMHTKDLSLPLSSEESLTCTPDFAGDLLWG